MSAAFVAWVALVIGVASLPYVVGVASSVPDAPFAGHLDPLPDDYSFHLGFAKQAAEGRLFFEYQQNGADSDSRAIVNLLFGAIGWLAAATGLPLVLAFHCVRIGVAVGILVSFRSLASHVLRDDAWTWVAVALLSFSSGLAWIEHLGLAAWPPGADLTWHPCPEELCWVEASTFWQMRQDVISAPAVLLLLVGFNIAVRASASPSVRDLLSMAAVAFVASWTRPQSLVTLLAVVGLAAVAAAVRPHDARARVGPVGVQRLWPLALPAAALGGALPGVLYSGAVVAGESEFWEIWGSKVFPVAQLAMELGLVGVLGAAGWVAAMAGGRGPVRFVALWVLGSLALMYTPVAPAGQIYCLEGLHAALCVLAAFALRELYGRVGLDLGGAAGRLVAATLVAFAALGTVTDVTNETAIAAGASEAPLPSHRFAAGFETERDLLWNGDRDRARGPYFLASSLREAYRWLDDHTDPSAVVLAPEYVTTMVPYRAGNRVYFGALEVSTNGEERLANLRDVYVFADDDEHRDLVARFLEDNRIDYVLHWMPGHGRYEPELTVPADIEAAFESLELVFENTDAAVFRVRESGD